MPTKHFIASTLSTFIFSKKGSYSIIIVPISPHCKKQATTLFKYQRGGQKRSKLFVKVPLVLGGGREGVAKGWEGFNFFCLQKDNNITSKNQTIFMVLLINQTVVILYYFHSS